jgi:hypothetical protein
MIIKNDIIINMMKNLLIIAMPLILVASVIVVASNANANVLGQTPNQTTAKTTPPMAKTTPPMPKTAKAQNPKVNMNEKLLNYTNQAILAFKDKNRTGEVNALKLIQNSLINASGKQVVIVPSEAVTKSKK